MKDCVGKAIALSGQLLGGHPISITLTPQAQQAKEEEGKAMKLYIGSLMSSLTEDDLRPVFEVYGKLDSLELQREPGSRENAGYGFVTFKREEDARQALKDLDGMTVGDRAIQV